MYKYIYMFFLFFLIACESNNRFSLKGTVLSTEYDGEIVYLVPFWRANSGNVDSTYIKNGTFSFEKQISENSIAIIRTRPLLRLRLEELLIVIEPGSLEVIMNEESTASGTLQNDRLQQWKEKKMQIDEAGSVLRQMFKVADDSSKVELQGRIDKLSEEYASYNYELVRENKENELGRFIFQMTKGSLSVQQREELNMPNE